MSSTISLCDMARQVHRSGKLADVRQMYQSILADQPENPDALHYLGLLLFEQNKPEEALQHLDQAAALRPDSPDFLNNHAVVLGKLAKHAESLALLDKAIALRPDYPEAHCNRGVALEALGRLDEAVAAFNRALELRKEYLDSLNNLGRVYRRLRHFDAAVGFYRRCVSIRPKAPDTHNNLGIALQEMGMTAEAIASFERAIDLNPEFPDPHWNLSLALLSRGDWPRGWIEYEWRTRMKFDEFKNLNVPMPAWNGAPLDGRTILLVAEQGLGDSIQFIRYAKLLQQRGAAVVAQVPGRLRTLLRNVAGVDRLIVKGESPGRCDCHIRMASLPGIFGTTPQTIPAETAYLHAEPDRIALWRPKLTALAGFKIGIAWQGNPKFGPDATRSIPLRHFQSLADCPNARLVSLQREFGAEQIKDWKHPIPIIELPPTLDAADAFADSAAIMSCLDLIITSDTALAHLAGALGLPVWLALSTAPDWRWLSAGQSTPWYPSMRLFRQTTPGDWDSVFAQMAAALAPLAGHPARVPSIDIPISPGELLDKITILRLKAERITDPACLAHVQRELDALRSRADQFLPQTAELKDLTRDLHDANAALWDVEDDLRRCEADCNFGHPFTALARSVYHANDRRASLKQAINHSLGAAICEQKLHPAYAAK